MLRNIHYENRVGKHFVTFHNFLCLVACLLCFLLMPVFFFLFVFACFAVRDLCRSGCRQSYYLTDIVGFSKVTTKSLASGTGS